MNHLEFYKLGVKNLGVLNLARLQVAKRFHKHRTVVEAHSKYLAHPVYFRPGSSDMMVFTQVFVEREYACLDDLQNVDLVIDLGGNVGYSSAYFLSRFPTCHVIVVEPDAANFELLQLNLAPYAGRVTAIRAAAWPDAAKLYLDSAAAGLGLEWGRRVTTEQGRSEAIDAVDVGSLLAMSKRRRISLLKIDIEGAERELFSRNYADWLDRTDNLAIEIHGEECRAAIDKAVQNLGFAWSKSGELDIGRRT